MAPLAESGTGGADLVTVITCEGTLGDPKFSAQFKKVVDRLNVILGGPVKVRKLEPWNSVRVTLSIPREAASRLRQLAAAEQGAQQLRALGILSVQVGDDQSISLRLAAAPGSESQEIILRTTQDGSSTNSAAADLGLGTFLSTAASAASASGGASASTSVVSAAAGNSQVQFKSPNVVCPPDSVVPKVGTNMATTSQATGLNKPPYAGPFPFASMNQAIQSSSSAASTSRTNIDLMPPPSSMPPPYPGGQLSNVKQPPVTISSPLLVNLLQNDHGGSPSSSKDLPPPPTVPKMRQTQSKTLHNKVNLINNSSSSSITPSNALIMSNNNSSVVNNSVTGSTLIRQPTSGGGVLLGHQQKIGSSNVGSLLPPPSPMAQFGRPQNVGMSKQKPSLPVPNNTQQQQVSNFVVPQQPSSNTAHQIQSNKSIPTLQSANASSLQSANVSMQSANVPIPQHQPGLSAQQSIANISSALQKSTSMHFGQQNNLLPQISNQQRLLNTTSGGLTSLHTGQDQNFGLNAHSTTSGVSFGQNEVLNNQTPNSVAKPLPSPPPYPGSVARNTNSWESLVHGSNLLDLTPSLTDLKPEELDDLLPSLTAHSPLPELSELDMLGGTEPPPSATNHQSNSNITSTASDSFQSKSGSVTVTSSSLLENCLEDGVGGDGAGSQGAGKFLINPLTGELELHEGGESDHEEDVRDVFTGLSSPTPPSDEDTRTSKFSEPVTDHSDSDTRSSGGEGKHPKVKNSTKANKEGRGRDSPALKQPEKTLKMKIKVERSEVVNHSAYKVESFNLKVSEPKKATSSVVPPNNPGSEEPKVPPLHISLRGRNSVVIKNKLNPDGTPKLKLKKLTKKEGDQSDSDGAIEHKKAKKFKGNHEHKDFLGDLLADQTSDLKSKYSLHNHYKEKQKERRGSDSELVRGTGGGSKKHLVMDANGALVSSVEDKKMRRLSQSESAAVESTMVDELRQQPPILGSTNVGTVMPLPQKPRKEKDKIKFKDSLKQNKDLNRKLLASIKSNLVSSEKLQQAKNQSSVALPTATDLDMEAKFKQSLMEGALQGEKGVPRPPHRTPGDVLVVNHMITQVEGSKVVASEKVQNPLQESPAAVLKDLKDKSPEPDKCNVPDRKSLDALSEKPLSSVTSGGRSPNSGSNGGQGEDSGIESMDALSEKSPNQSSQSPHADLILPHTGNSAVAALASTNSNNSRNNSNIISNSNDKTEVPDMLEDIEAQLAKMEGLESEEVHNGNKTASNVIVTDRKSPSSNRSSIEDDEVDINLPKAVNIKIDGSGDVGAKAEHLTSLKSDLESPQKQQVSKEDVNENKCHHDHHSKSKSLCCELSCGESVTGSDKQQRDERPSAVTVLKTEDKDVELEGLSLRVTNPLYGYSNSAPKGGPNSRGGSESPTISERSIVDEEESSNHSVISASTANSQNSSTASSNTSSTGKNNKSLLEQLLIEIPNDSSQTSAASSPSPATRSSVRTRALTKMNSPTEINLSATLPKTAQKQAPSTAKRKRNGSESSNQSTEDNTKTKRPRKTAAENAEAKVKTAQANAIGKKAAKGAVQPPQHQQGAGVEESSDSDEPLMEKVRKTGTTTQQPTKTAAKANSAGKAQQIPNKVNSQSQHAAHQPPQPPQQPTTPHVNTRRSVRTPAAAAPPSPAVVNTRSKTGPVVMPAQTPAAAETAAAEAVIRRKTRSADVESKRKKEIK